MDISIESESKERGARRRRRRFKGKKNRRGRRRRRNKSAHRMTRQQFAHVRARRAQSKETRSVRRLNRRKDRAENERERESKEVLGTGSGQRSRKPMHACRGVSHLFLLVLVFQMHFFPVVAWLARLKTRQLRLAVMGPRWNVGGRGPAGPLRGPRRVRAPWQWGYQSDRLVMTGGKAREYRARGQRWS